MLSYLEVLVKYNFITKEDFLIIGKPWGSQAYYLLWEKYWNLDISNLSIGVKHDEIDFLDYGEETMGNALGVASGIAMTTDKKVWVNLSDATLQIGNTMEAIQFIGLNNLNNIITTVDFNNMQVTGEVDAILSVRPIVKLFKNCGWNVQCVKYGHREKTLKHIFERHFKVGDKPTVFIIHTVKGHGVPFMEENPRKWHYRKLDETDIKQIS